ncbi:hypothetical protein BDZ89DRAFT_391382 [Hymenopellis radicata]|nr:hypothetical protein BDZ89DRAFT_391382 [Hymenopellis radicata]
MKPSTIRFSGMPGPRREWIRWFGDKEGIAVQRGVYQYSLSPFQLKVGPNWARGYLEGALRHLKGEARFYTVPFLFGIGVYVWANDHYAYLNSKANHVEGDK